jgi:hypothetical protein
VERAFTPDDNEKRFIWKHSKHNLVGKLEYPISDRGQNSLEGQGILWFEKRLPDNGAGWVYASPADVDEVKQ